ncbi:MAG TPA: hypothetical protein PKH89_04725 [Anaerolineae bacterium]|nr:hypothetical protein [Anaerolineae bacterium]
MRHKRALRVLAVTCLACWLASGFLVNAHAQAPNQVGLVVQFGDGSVVTRCVSFAESEISGLDVLLRSGLDVVAAYSSTGAAICSINGEGCPPENCFCQCQGSTCVYWTYWHLGGGSWNYSQLGAGSYRVHGGEVEGYRWWPAEAPPFITFDQICAPPPTQTPIPIATPRPPTVTPIPQPKGWFRLDQNPVDAGTCTTIRWDTWDTETVYLNGESVALNGFRQVCPTVQQTYRLRVVGNGSEATYELILGVTTVASPTPTRPKPTITSASPALGTPSPSPFPSPTMSPSPALQTQTPYPIASITPTSGPTSSARMTTPAEGGPSPTPTSTAQTLAPVPSATALPLASGGQPSASLLGRAGYAFFLVVAASLLGWLIFLARRRG